MKVVLYYDINNDQMNKVYLESFGTCTLNHLKKDCDLFEHTYKKKKAHIDSINHSHYHSRNDPSDLALLLYSKCNYRRGGEKCR